MASEEENEDYFLPLVDQRVFGAGIKRKRIAFVPASSIEGTSSPTTSNSQTAAERYLSIVLKEEHGAMHGGEEPVSEGEPMSDATPVAFTRTVCAVCKQPISIDTGVAHESSIAHQLCLEHSLPPSHLDRQHIGVKYLAGYGWDPDSRVGLGARAEGIRAPVKAKEKRDNIGVGFGQVDEDRPAAKNVVKKEENIVKLNAKQVRQNDDELRKRAEKLRQDFYGQDLAKYGLG